MLALVRRWRPDVILRETLEFASLLAAEVVGVPALRSSASWPPPRGSTGACASRWRDCAASSACARASTTRATSRCRRARWTRRAAAPLRFRAPADAAAPLPDWWRGSRTPLVYVSFGSARRGQRLLPGALPRGRARARRARRPRADDARHRGRPGRRSAQCPANVHVERWVPQAQVMPHAAAMVGHGGSGSTLAAMAAGMPLAVLPLFADQAQNARRVAQIGAGLHARARLGARPCAPCSTTRRTGSAAQRVAARDRRPRADRRRRTAAARNHFRRAKSPPRLGACASRSSFWPS